jgi:hypothetical protein
VHDFAVFVHFASTVVGVLGIFELAKRGWLPTDLRPSRNFPVRAFALAALALIVFEVVSWRITTPGDAFWDFLNAYYPAGLSVVRDDPTMLRTLISKGVQGFVNIPLVAYRCWLVSARSPS